MKHPISDKLDHVAQSAVPEAPYLWDAISERMTSTKTASQRRKARSSQLRRLWLVPAMFMLVMLAFIPRVQTVFIKGVDYGLNLVGKTGLSLSNSSNISSTLTMIPTTTLALAQTQIVYPIPTPQWLPDDIKFQHATVFDQTSLQIAYRSNQDQQRGLALYVYSGDSRNGSVHPKSQAINFTINGYPAIMYKGSWDQDMNWHDKTPIITIKWKIDNFEYELQTGSISEEDTVRIAEPIQNPKVR